jgi:hypothetical protein
MEFVCPKENILHEVYLTLLDYYNKKREFISGPPPKPLVLNGWIYSTDYQKKIRWEETIKWAQTYGCSNLIPILKSGDKYEVAKIVQTFIQEEDPYGSEQ